jgi:hypothetical protein
MDIRPSSLPGRWWLPAEPAVQYSGTLTLNEDNHGELILGGSPAQLSAIARPGERTWHGILRSRYQYDVTLFNVGVMKGPNVASRAQEVETEATFFTNDVLIGSHIDSEEIPCVRGALVKLTGLDIWWDESGFSGDTTVVDGPLRLRSVSLQYEERATEVFEVVPDVWIRFQARYEGATSFSHVKSVPMRESVYLELLFAQEVSLTKLQREIQVWQQFFSIGLREAVYIDEIRLRFHEAPEAAFPFELRVPGRRQSDLSGAHRGWFRLHTRSKLGDRLGRVLRTWRQRYDDLETVIALVSGAAYQEQAHTHVKLLAYLQALEILHRQRLGGSRFPNKDLKERTFTALRAALPQDLPETIRKDISQQISFIGSLTLVERLGGVFAQYPKTLGRLFKSPEGDMALLRDVRNFLVHYGEKARFGIDILSSPRLMVLHEKARLFAEIAMLGELGIDDEELPQFLTRFEPYAEWSHVDHD